MCENNLHHSHLYGPYGIVLFEGNTKPDTQFKEKSAMTLKISSRNT